GACILFPGLGFISACILFPSLGFVSACTLFPGLGFISACILFPGLDVDADDAAAGCIVSIHIQQFLRTAAGSEEVEKHAHKVHYFMLG
ncbi:MAG: hypothetical protein ACJ8BW_30750, partial [Ktedonobacteraceae bacterium]